MNYPTEVPIRGRTRKVLELAQKQNLAGKVIVDVGSTFGWLAKEVRESKPKAYNGVEPNEKALEYAQKHNSWARFYKGNASNIPLKDKSVDVAFFFDVIEHIPSGTEVKALGEIARVLKKDGVLILTTPYDHLITKLTDPAWYFGHRHYSKEKLQRYLNEAGFVLESFSVKGGFICLVYMLWFYFSKWVLRKNVDKGWLATEDDKSYDREGIATVFLKAKKR